MEIQEEEAYLCFGAGVKLRMEYGTQSGADTSYAAVALKNGFSYGSAERDYRPDVWSRRREKVIENIKKGWPVQIAIRRKGSLEGIRQYWMAPGTGTPMTTFTSIWGGVELQKTCGITFQISAPMMSLRKWSMTSVLTRVGINGEQTGEVRLVPCTHIPQKNPN